MAGQSGRSQQEDSVVDVAKWEKEFFREVGSMDWDEMVQVRKSIHLFPDIMQWNDSAAKEAIIDAKIRYWAQKNRVGSDIPLPHPHLYVHKIDWDAKLDPLLVQEFEDVRAVSDNEGDEDRVVQNSNLVVPSLGWGAGEQTFEGPPADPWGGYFNSWGVWSGANHVWHGYDVCLGNSSYTPNMDETNACAHEPQASEERMSYPWGNGNKNGCRRHPYTTRRQRQRRSTPRGSDAIQLTGQHNSNQY